MPISATWHLCATSSELQRSSHTVNIVENRLHIFGGELIPRQPRDNQVLVVDLEDSSESNVKSILASSNSPPPRVGAASTVLNGKLYLFSGRGGQEMTPIEEMGALWVYDSKSGGWSQLTPASPSDPYPQARSYHCATNDGSSSIFIHAGCPVSGRLMDLWSFDINKRVWTQLADGPAPPRGGPSIAFMQDRIYRMNGFDGQKEQGGTIDIYNLQTNTWDFKPFTADGVSGPAPRSVGTLLRVQVNSSPMMVTLFGEGDPSALGHAGAGKMFDDVWAYDTEQEHWTKVETKRDYDKAPAARGWFDADVMGESNIILAGGLGEDNERLQDCWMLKFERSIS